MKAGKNLPNSSRLQSVLYYGLAICATGGTGGFIWHQSSKLDHEPAPIVAPALPVQPDDEPKTIVTFGEAKPDDTAAKSTSVRGEIMIRGRAGTTKTLAPATELDRSASASDNIPRPAYPVTTGAGPSFYVADDPTRTAREAQSRRDEELRQDQKRQADNAPMWQKRVTQK